MKKILLMLPLSILFLCGVSAQKVRYKKDMVTVDDKPYCKMVSKGFTMVTYTIKSLDDKLVAIVKPQMGETSIPGLQYYFVMTFMESGNQCELQPDMGFGTQLAKDMVEAGLFKDSSMVAGGERNFLLLHKQKFSSDPNAKAENILTNSNSTMQYKTVERRKTGNISIYGDYIQQSGVEIGKVKMDRAAQAGGIKTVLTYYLPDGTKIAEATFTGIDSDNTAKVITFKDQNTTSVSIHEHSKTKDVAAFLSENGYL